MTDPHPPEEPMTARKLLLVARTPVTLLAVLALVVLTGLWGYNTLTAPLPPPKPKPCVMQDIGPDFKPEHGTLRVYNGTDRNGFGRRVAAMLRAEGFRVIRIANSPEPIQGVTVVGVDKDSPEVKLVMSYFPKATFTADPDKIDHTVDVTIGDGWDSLARRPLKSVPLPDGKACIAPIQSTQDTEGEG